MTDVERAEALVNAAPRISEKELEQMNGLFPAYLFRRKRTREIWTSCCGRHEVIGEPLSDAMHTIMVAEHQPEPRGTNYYCHCGYISAPAPKKPEKITCPFCGREVRLKELGRTGRRDNLTAYRRMVALRWYRGALWARAGYICKRYDTIEGLTAKPDHDICKVYRFVAGKAEHTNSVYGGGAVTGMCKMDAPPKKLPMPFYEPFPYSSEYGMGCDLVGAGEVEKSPFRYCQFNKYSERKYALMRFLALCTQYPRQVEMMMKAGFSDAVSDLVEGKRWNRSAFRWEEENPCKSFGLSREELRQFLAGDKDLEQLAAYKRLRDGGVATTFLEIGALWRILPYGKAAAMVSRLVRYRLTVTRMVHYIQKEKSQRGQKRLSERDLIVQWLDYVDAAVVLGYDMKNQVMLTPKELCKKHDAATAAAAPILAAKRNAEDYKKMREITCRLTERYTFSTDRWLIRPPVGTAEIVAEGKALHHCVGGYADRHMKGSTTILFLRDRKRPGVPLVTIEMRGDKIAQIHGRNNDANEKVKPRERYAELLDPWLDWISKGSKRDKAGRPKLAKKKEVQVA